MLTFRPWKRKPVEGRTGAKETPRWRRLVRLWARRTREECGRMYVRLARTWPAIREWAAKVTHGKPGATPMP